MWWAGGAKEGEIQRTVSFSLPLLYLSLPNSFLGGQPRLGSRLSSWSGRLRGRGQRSLRQYREPRFPAKALCSLGPLRLYLRNGVAIPLPASFKVWWGVREDGALCARPGAAWKRVPGGVTVSVPSVSIYAGLRAPLSRALALGDAGRLSSSTPFSTALALSLVLHGFSGTGQKAGTLARLGLRKHSGL